MAQGIASLFGARLKVINVGLALFAESLREQETEVLQVDWRPPAGGDGELIELLDKLKQVKPPGTTQRSPDSS
jgi:hypothetical protein